MKAASCRALVGVALAFVVFANVAPAAVPAPPPAEAFGALPQVSDVVLSPNGNLLAWHDRSGPEPRIVFFDITTQKYRRMARIPPDVTPRRLDWVDDETLLITCWMDWHGLDIRAQALRVLATDVGGGDTRVLMHEGVGPYFNVRAVVAVRTPKPKAVLLSGWASRGKARLFEVDTRTGEATMVEPGSEFTREWVVDANAQAVARSEWLPASSVYRVLAKRDSEWHEIFRQKGLGGLWLYGRSADGRAVIASGAMGADSDRLLAVALDGSGIRTLVEDPVNMAWDVIHDHITGLPVAAQLGGLEQPVRWLDAQAERRFQSLAQSFPGRRVSVSGESDNRQRLVAAVDGPAGPRVFYLVDFSTHKADIIGEAYPALANANLGEARTLTYKARDGLAIPAYLTLPPGSTGRKLPVVILPHGGPNSRDEYEFHWLAQFLAVRGFAVLQPQFRGSIGFGRKLELAGDRQWGRLMQDDLSDGVKALMEQGVAEAGRVCIVGDGPYAGFAALAGAALTPELYACAVSVDGVSDASRYYGYVSTHTEGSDVVYRLRDFIGSPSDAQLIAKSPLRNADHV
ncbi:MAG TPA: prolyl oligopeptidase family serine peptidase, partial [Steroidobacteraceae bacterium]|nr:prolyl oligopeptidase family serine peptidase [Steroidobacteraceae bacterium]